MSKDRFIEDMQNLSNLPEGFMQTFADNIDMLHKSTEVRSNTNKLANASILYLVKVIKDD